MMMIMYVMMVGEYLLTVGVFENFRTAAKCFKSDYEVKQRIHRVVIAVYCFGIGVCKSECVKFRRSLERESELHYLSLPNIKTTRARGENTPLFGRCELGQTKRIQTRPDMNKGVGKWNTDMKYTP